MCVVTSQTCVYPYRHSGISPMASVVEQAVMVILENIWK